MFGTTSQKTVVFIITFVGLAACNLIQTADDPFSVSRDFLTLFVKTCIHKIYFIYEGKGKGKSVPLQALSGPEGSRKLGFPDYMTATQDGGKVVGLMCRPPLIIIMESIVPSRNIGCL